MPCTPVPNTLWWPPGCLLLFPGALALPGVESPGVREAAGRGVLGLPWVLLLQRCLWDSGVSWWWLLIKWCIKGRCAAGLVLSGAAVPRRPSWRGSWLRCGQQLQLGCPRSTVWGAMLLGAQLQLRGVLKHVRVSLGLAASLLSPGVFVGETGTVKPPRCVGGDAVPPSLLRSQQSTTVGGGCAKGR